MRNDIVYVVKKLLPKVKQDIILLGEDSSLSTAVYLGEIKKGHFDVASMMMPKFMQLNIESLWGKAPYDPKVAAGIFLATPGAKFSNAAFDQIERILNLDTRGKSTTAIHAEVVRLAAEELPKGHPLKDVPKSFPDRGQAIAAFTAMRSAILKLNNKESDSMATKKTAAPAAETKKPTKAEAAAAAKATKDAKAKEAADKKTADAAAKVKAKADAEAAKKSAKNGKADDAKPAAGKKKEGGKAAEKAAKVLTGAYVLNGKSTTVKSPEELRLHEGSSRYKLMAFMFAQAPKHKNGVPVEKIVAEMGGDAAYALTSMTKTGYEFLKKVEA